MSEQTFQSSGQAFKAWFEALGPVDQQDRRELAREAWLESDRRTREDTLAASAAERERLRAIAKGWRECAAKTERDAGGLDRAADGRIYVWDSCAEELEAALSSGQGGEPER